MCSTALLIILVFMAIVPAGATDTTRISLDSAGAEGNADSLDPDISADGRYVVFYSDATNLVPSDTNGHTDIFIRDRTASTISLISVDSAGALANRNSYYPVISANNQYVVFTSIATNLVSGDTNGVADIFVRDLATSSTTRISVDSAGTQANSYSVMHSVSSDGRYVAFDSTATNLVAGDTNGVQDIFVHDRTTGTTSRISVDSAGTEGDGASSYPSISADGRYVVFTSEATNLVPGDTNLMKDIFVHDRTTGTTSRISVSSAGAEADGYSHLPTISSDGRYVSFTSDATTLVSGDTNGKTDIFVHDRTAGTTVRISVDSTGAQANNGSDNPAISGDGTVVVFLSSASNLVAGDTNGVDDIFIHVLSTGITSRSSVSSSGGQSNAGSLKSALSADGKYVAFDSGASNLVTGDTNGVYDIFVHESLSQPVASFTGTPVTGTAPLSVTFTGTSTNSPVSWNWSFGDGSWFNTTDSLQKDPVHVYAAAGTYTVRLIVANAAGTDTQTRADYVTVSLPSSSGSGTPASSYNPGGGGSDSDDAGTTVTGQATGNKQPSSPQEEAGVPVGGNSAVTSVLVIGTGIEDLIVTGFTQAGPGDNSPPPGDVYQYIALTAYHYESIDGATITFTVPQAWLDEHHMTPQDITMYHSVNGQWVALPTTVVSTTNGIVTFTATSPGFSLFAIIGVAREDAATGERKIQTFSDVAGSSGPAPEGEPARAQAGPAPAAAETTAAPVPASQSSPGSLLPVLAVAGIIVLCAGGFVARRWWIRRQNPALFGEMD
ncbi:MAG: PGF-pre-PGF domain-containing protein [Methanomicrobiales archaeon]|nr:PGF-pre-PGF domain-containing protein [Methanomicrobiales archaeon]